jgi:hypothetical protein
LKIELANEKLNGLRASVDEFLKSEPFTLQLQRHDDSSITRAIQVVRIKKEIPVGWSLIVGEIVHNLRSALDHLVYQLVIHETGSPPPSTYKKGQFPIFKTAEGFKSRGAPVMLKGVGVKAVELIKSVQPFETEEGTKSPLWLLSELSNWDKHRSIPLTGASINNISVGATAVPGFRGFGFVPNGPFEDDTALAWVRFDPSSEPLLERVKKVQAEWSFTLYIGFGKPEAVRGNIATSCLAEMLKRVLDIADRVYKEIFGGRQSSHEPQPSPGGKPNT